MIIIHLQHRLRAGSLRPALERRLELAAFLIVEIDGVRDEATYALYREEVSANLAAAGGEYLVRGGEVEVLEGNWRPGRVVVVRFDSMQAARDWWNSPAYAELKSMRQRSTNTKMLIVEGLPNV
jgi:uncharacterized protein (DUF1330 family)